MTTDTSSGIWLRGVSLDYPLPSHARKGEGAEFGAVGGRFAEFRGRRFVRALDDLTVTIRGGERVALLGGNGSGKSTLLKVMAGLLPIAKGSVNTQGRVTTMFNTSVGMDPSLSGYDNLERLAALHNLPRSHIVKVREDIAAFTELGGFLKLPVKTYSAGMRTRLGFGFATAVPSDILLVDEVIGAGDASFSERARDRLKDQMRNSGIVVLASHSTSVLRNFCNRGLVLSRGRLEFAGELEEAISIYQTREKHTKINR
jgi:ABC-type polysaccharide/polyol phosphate transport system ATPase subunit